MILRVTVLLLVAGTTAPPAPRTVRAASPAQAQAADTGLAAFYAPRFHGRRTASGETFDPRELVAAHPTLPFGTVLRVTNLANGKSVDVRVADRGPSAASRRAGVIIDLSRAAAERLGLVERGRARVRLEVLRRGGGAPR